MSPTIWPLFKIVLCALLVKAIDLEKTYFIASLELFKSQKSVKKGSLYVAQDLSTINIFFVFYACEGNWRKKKHFSASLEVFDSQKSFKKGGLYFAKDLTTTQSFFCVLCFTANLFTVKNAGFHCVQFPTVVSLYFLQWSTACSGSLMLKWRRAKSFHFCSLITAIFDAWYRLRLQLNLYNSIVLWLQCLQFGITNFYC